MTGRTLISEMKTLFNEAGALRKNAETTVGVAAIAMASSAEALKTASKAYETAISQLSTALPAAHEMSNEELKALKKLLDQTATTRSKLKKYTQYASANADAALKLRSMLATPASFTRPVEPDPNKPFDPARAHSTLALAPSVPTVSKPKPKLSKPNLSASDYQLYVTDVDAKLKALSKQAASALNSAMGKAYDELEKKLPKLDYYHNKGKVNDVLYAAYEKIIAPVMKKFSAAGANDTEPRGVLMNMLSDAARTIYGVGKGELNFYDLW